MNTPTTPPAPAVHDYPTPSEVDGVKQRFPMDAVSQKAIDIKYTRRRGPGWTPISLAELTESLTKFLSSRIGDSFTVRDTHWLTGGASKIQMGFTLNWYAPKRGQVSDRMLLRMDPPETLNTTYKQTEVEITEAVSNVIPVPRVLWSDPLGQEFPEPALIYTLANGVTKPTAARKGNVTGIGTQFDTELRAELVPQFIDHLATMHTLDCATLDSEAVAVPKDGTSQSASWRLNFERAIWELDRSQDLGVMEVAASWMQRNLPVTERVSIVHGDFRSGNFLFDEDTSQITAWLDWELSRVGDRHEDLAYCTHPLFGGMSEDGTTFLASGLLPPEDLLERYEKASGLPVDPTRIEWYSVLCTYSAILRTLATPYRVARLGRSHQDILLTRLEGTVPVLMRHLVTLLEKVV